MKQAVKRARWSMVPALSIAFAFAVSGASAAGPGGWDHLGEFKTPKIAPLNGAVYALSAESDNGLLVGGAFNFKTADGRPAAHLAVVRAETASSTTTAQRSRVPQTLRGPDNRTLATRLPN